jgi:hypothetical protein
MTKTNTHPYLKPLQQLAKAVGARIIARKDCGPHRDYFQYVLYRSDGEIVSVCYDEPIKLYPAITAYFAGHPEYPEAAKEFESRIDSQLLADLKGWEVA